MKHSMIFVEIKERFSDLVTQNLKKKGEIWNILWLLLKWREDSVIQLAKTWKKKRNMKYSVISVDMQHSPCHVLVQNLTNPVLAPGTPLRSGPGSARRRLPVALLLQIIYSWEEKIHLDQVLHSSSVFKACVIPPQSISIYTAITEQNYRSPCRKPLLMQEWADLN